MENHLGKTENGTDKLNIGIVTTWFERGAAYVSRAYHQTLSNQHNVFIYARGGEEYALGDPNWDKDYVTWGKKVTVNQSTFIDWKDFKSWALKHNLEVIIFNEQQDWNVVVKCMELDILIGAYVDYYTHKTIYFFNLYDFLLCNTKRHYSVFKNHPQAVYIPWGTDISIFKPHKNKPPNDSVTFFHSAGMGGIGLRKGTDLLVQAFQGIKGNAKLTIHSQIGPDKYGNSSDLILNDPRITFIEKTVPPPGLYYLGDVYVYPSRLDGIGLTIAEALASGLPVITTDESPMNEFVHENLTGKLVEVEFRKRRNDDYYWPESHCSISSLTSAMQFYIDNPSKIEIHSLQAVEYAHQYLDWSRNSLRLTFLMGRLTKKRSNSKKLRWLVNRYVNENSARDNLRVALYYLNTDNFSLARKHFIRALFLSPFQNINFDYIYLCIHLLFGGKIAKKILKSVGVARQKLGKNNFIAGDTKIHEC